VLERRTIVSPSRERAAGGNPLRHPAELPFYGLRFILGHELGHIRLHQLAQLPQSHPFTVRRLERPYRLGLLHARVREAEPETTV